MGIRDIVIMIEKEESLNLGKEIGIDLGKDLGIDLEKREVIYNAHKEGLSLDLIATIVKLPVAKVQEILNERLKSEN